MVNQLGRPKSLDQPRRQNALRADHGVRQPDRRFRRMGELARSRRAINLPRINPLPAQKSRPLIVGDEYRTRITRARGLPPRRGPRPFEPTVDKVDPSLAAGRAAARGGARSVRQSAPAARRSRRESRSASRAIHVPGVPQFGQWPAGNEARERPVPFQPAAGSLEEKESKRQ